MLGRIHSLLAALTVLVCRSHSVTLTDPCDPVERNMTVEKFFGRAAFLLEYMDRPIWTTLPLNFVNCSRRGLTRVPSSASGDTEMLDLSFNLIRHYHRSSFDGYPRLVALYLSSNCIQTVGFPFCRVNTVIESGTFDKLKHLKVLTLRGNNMTAIPSDLPPSLVWLDTSLTFSPPLKPQDISRLTSLSSLVSVTNCFPRLTNYCPRSFTASDYSLTNATKILILTENNLSKIPVKLLTNKLLYLDFSFNPLRSLDGRDFARAVALKSLKLKGLRTWPTQSLRFVTGTLENLKSLVLIDLSYNYIEYIPKNFFRNNQLLKTVILSQNCLWNYVENPFFLPTTNLRLLDISANAMCFRKRLDLSKMYLRLGPVYETMHQLQVLYIGPAKTFSYYESLNLHFEKLDEKSLLPLKNLSQLKKISLAFCGFKTIHTRAFSSLKTLEFLDVSHNALQLSTAKKTVDSDFKLKTTFSENQHYTHKASGNLSLRQEPEVDGEKEFTCNGRRIPYLLSHNDLKNLTSALLNLVPSTTHLDLSYNDLHQLYPVFDGLVSLCDVDLSGNPLQVISPDTFSNVSSLRNLKLHGTRIMRKYDFLFQIKSPLSFRCISESSELYGSLYLSGHVAPFVYEIDFSNSIVNVQDQFFFKRIFNHFPNVKKISLRNCGLSLPGLIIANVYLAELDISGNLLQDLPALLLFSLPSLERFAMSNNKMSSLRYQIFQLAPKLRHMDLSHNRISYIKPGCFKSDSNQLQHLDLSYNYIVDIGPTVFDLTTLSSLKYFDIRWNSIKCECSLTDTFGLWFPKRHVPLAKTPGMLPHCTQAVNQYFGGCVFCANFPSKGYQSVLLYSSDKTCNESLEVSLAISATTFITAFLVSVIICQSASWKRWLYRRASKQIKPSIARATNSSPPQRIFAFHVFVVFDDGNTAVADWVDDFLIPWLCDLSPQLEVGCSGRSNHCGMSPVNQTLLQIESSKKVIVVASETFCHSNEGNYVLSALEYLAYKYGDERCTFVLFDRASNGSNYIQKRFKENPLSVISYPQSQDEQEVFWEALRESISI